ncbi:MAG: hypothetical protein LBI47_00260 [Puniceicoccales bacterium]|jgi:hypothetical protein|nr:hypothetical protein [Puniceicoccales bacterium]
MAKKNVKRLMLAIEKLCHWDKALSDDENQRIVDGGFVLLEEVATTKDSDVLCEMFDVFNNEDKDDALANGVCETLENEIYRHFDFSQIMNVLYQKFGSLIENNILRARNISCACINVGKFEDFRKMFNLVRSKDSALLLDKIKYKDKYNKEIVILTKDMAGW